MSIDGRPRLKIVIFGASGQMGRSLVKKLEASSLGHEVFTIPWSKINTEQGFSDFIKFAANQLKADDAILFANGLTDPRLSYKTLVYSNLSFPKMVIEATENMAKLRYISFGSVLENVPELCEGNPYIQTKKMLYDLVCEKSRVLEKQLVHLRLHTLYSSNPAKHMFLGQIFDAMAKGEEFHMSDGRQLRQYHHVDDAAATVVGLLERGWEDVLSDQPTLELSSGEFIKLSELANYLFSELDQLSLLKIGKIESQSGEVYSERRPERVEIPILGSRPPLEGVCACLRNFLETVV